jgi:hypothetical protein
MRRQILVFLHYPSATFLPPNLARRTKYYCATPCLQIESTELRDAYYGCDLLRQQSGLAGRCKMSTPCVSFADTRRVYISITAHCCETYTNFAVVQLGVLANQVIPFYIESPTSKKNRSDATGDFKIIEWLAYLSLDLIYCMI